ncbi:uncharacterized protein LOC135805057 isoform X2 [Sycon ciliatum]|uniref:uncharacterized protein LOC135805057 isoform X2 n=1 Tax=Sycon ciliatum TaxID=27933 RepID=UPI0031F5F276
MADVDSASAVSQLSTNWLSGCGSKKSKSTPNASSFSILIQERPESLGVGAKVSAKEREKAKHQARVRDAICKGLKANHRQKDTGHRRPDQALAAKRQIAEAESSSSDEEESRTAIAPRKKKKC